MPRSRLRRSTRVVPSKYAERLSIYAAFEKAVHFKRTTQPAHGMRSGHCRRANANDLQIKPRPPGRNHIGTGARKLRSVNTRGSRAATSSSSQRTSSASAKARQSGMPPAMPPEWQQLSFRFGTTGPTRVLSMRCLVAHSQGAFVPARSGLPSHVATSPALRARRRSPRPGARQDAWAAPPPGVLASLLKDLAPEAEPSPGDGVSIGPLTLLPAARSASQ